MVKRVKNEVSNVLRMILHMNPAIIKIDPFRRVDGKVKGNVKLYGDIKLLLN